MMVFFQQMIVGGGGEVVRRPYYVLTGKYRECDRIRGLFKKIYVYVVIFFQNVGLLKKLSFPSFFYYRAILMLPFCFFVHSNFLGFNSSLSPSNLTNIYLEKRVS